MFNKYYIVKESYWYIMHFTLSMNQLTDGAIHVYKFSVWDKLLKLLK